MITDKRQIYCVYSRGKRGSKEKWGTVRAKKRESERERTAVELWTLEEVCFFFSVFRWFSAEGEMDVYGEKKDQRRDLSCLKGAG